MARMPLICSFSNTEIARAIRRTVGKRPSFTPSSRVLRTVGNYLDAHYTKRSDLDKTVEDAIRIATSARATMPRREFDIYVAVVRSILERRGTPKPRKPRFDDRRQLRRPIQREALMTV